MSYLHWSGFHLLVGYVIAFFLTPAPKSGVGGFFLSKIFNVLKSMHIYVSFLADL